MGIRYAKPPVLMHDVIDDMGAVVSLLESQAPYDPLGGWYNPGADPHARTRPMWFQNDWVHDTFAAVWGSPLVADGKVYLGDEDGDVVVLQAGRKEVVLGEMFMEGAVYGSVVPANGALIIASRNQLFSITLKP